MKIDVSQRWQICSSKYDGSFHRLWTCAYPQQATPMYVDDTVPYFSLLVPARTSVMEPSGQVWSSPYDVIACFYATKHYQVMILLKANGTEYYCNSCGIPEIDTTKREVRFVDLDLDLLVDHTRSMRVVDRVEFERHASRYHYSEEMVARVEQDLDELLQMVSNHRGVFSEDHEWRRRNRLTSYDAGD